MTATDSRDEWDLHWRARRADEWHPLGVIRDYARRRPEVGDVVAWERAAWEVMHVRVGEPTDDEAKRLAAYRPEDRDARMPYRIALRRLHGPRHDRENSAGDVGLRAPALMQPGTLGFYERARVPLCSCCGHPWPCLAADAQDAAEASGELMDRRMSRMGPGICYGCGEPITSRQGKFTMTGDHADFPGAPPPEFHARKKCDEHLLAYKKRAETQAGVER